MDLDAIMNVVLPLSKEVGNIVQERLLSVKKEVQTKDHKHDFVTDTDQEVEKILMDTLRSNFPTHKFIGEETAASGVKATLTDDPTWIIDPVDGTLNFVHGYPSVCVSIGLTVKKEPVLGVINVPAMDMLFTAIKGKGAFLNGKPIHVSNTKALEDALIAVEFSGASGNKERHQACMNYTEKLLPVVHSFRNNGSACFNLAMVALGGCDMYFEIGIHVWDIAAGVAIVREAGGVVIDVQGGALDLMNRRFIAASTRELALEAVKYINIPKTKLIRDDE